MRESNPLRESDGRDADLDLIFERVRQSRLRLRTRPSQWLLQRLRALIAALCPPHRGD